MRNNNIFVSALIKSFAVTMLAVILELFLYFFLIDELEIFDKGFIVILIFIPIFMFLGVLYTTYFAKKKIHDKTKKDTKEYSNNYSVRDIKDKVRKDDVSQVVKFLDEEENKAKSGFPLYSVKNSKGSQMVLNDKDPHAMLIAPTGSGKTTKFIKTGIVANSLLSSSEKPNFIINDVKGDLYNDLSSHLENKGYKVLRFNTNLINDSNRWNPLFEIKDRFLNKEDYITQIKMLSSLLIPSTGGDTFWVDSSRNLLSALIEQLLYSIEYYGMSWDKFSFWKIVELSETMQSLELFVDNDELSDDNSKFREMMGSRVSLVKGNFSGYNESPEKTKASIYSSFRSALGKSMTINILNLTSNVDEGNKEVIKIKDFLNDEPIALFLTFNETNIIENWLGSLFVTMFYNKITKREIANGGRKVQLWMDEFSNYPKIENLDGILSLARSKGVQFIITLQSHSRLKAKYKDEWGDVTSNAGQITIMGANEPKEAEYLSSFFGKKTYNTNSLSSNEKGSGTGINNAKKDDFVVNPTEILQLKASPFSKVFVKSEKGNMSCVLEPSYENEYINNIGK